MIWSTLQLTSKLWYITQQITARADLFLKYKYYVGSSDVVIQSASTISVVSVAMDILYLNHGTAVVGTGMSLVITAIVQTDELEIQHPEESMVITGVFSLNIGYLKQGCGFINFFYLFPDKSMVKIHLSNQNLLARKLIFFIMKKTYVVGTH